MNDRRFYFVTWRPLFDHGLCYIGRRASLYIGRSSAHISDIINVFYYWVPEQNIICFLFLSILWMFPANVLEDQRFRVRLLGNVTIRRADCPIGRWCRQWPGRVSMVNVGMGRSRCPSGRGLDIRYRASRTWWGCSDCLCGYCCLFRLRHLPHCPAIALAPRRRPGAVLRRGHDLRPWTSVTIIVECGGCARGRRRRQAGRRLTVQSAHLSSFVQADLGMSANCLVILGVLRHVLIATVHLTVFVQPPLTPLSLPSNIYLRHNVY